MVLFSTLIESTVDLREGVTPRAVVILASETILFLLGMYEERCGFLSVHPLLPHMIFAATLVQTRRTCDQRTEQQTFKVETGDKRKRCSGSQTPVRSRSSGAPQSLPPYRSPSHLADAENLIFPSWQHHITHTTLNQAGITTNIKTEPDGNPVATHIWPSKPASKLAAEGTLHLTKIGITNRKAASLAKILHSHSTTTRSPSASVLSPSPSVEGWKSVNWSSTGVGNGIGGQGVDSLQGFSAMTDHHPPAAVGAGPCHVSVGVDVIPQAAASRRHARTSTTAVTTGARSPSAS